MYFNKVFLHDETGLGEGVWVGVGVRVMICDRSFFTSVSRDKKRLSILHFFLARFFPSTGRGPEWSPRTTGTTSPPLCTSFPSTPRSSAHEVGANADAAANCTAVRGTP